jgi:exodeoxyribonuclease-5
VSTKVQIIKRLEVIKNLIELEDEDSIHFQIEKLKEENNEELKEIITILENDDYTKINKAIDDYVYGYKNAKLTPHQQKVFDNIIKDISTVLANYDNNSIKTASKYFFSLTGSAGTGKTFLTSKLVEEFIKRKYKILLTTPTHKSLSVAKYMINSNNVHINAKTLQSYLDLKLKEDYLLGTKSFQRDKTSDMFDFERNLDILIVDESSMVSNKLLKFIEENLVQNKLKTVLFIGDQYQLPPVDEEQNGVINLPNQYQLTEIVRQAKDSYIKVIANEIKECIKNREYKPIPEIFDTSKYNKLEVFDNEKDFLNKFTSKNEWYKENNQVLAYTNSQVDRHNRLLRYRYWKSQNIEPTDAIIKGEKLIFNETYSEFQNSEIVTVNKVTKGYDKYKKIIYWNCIDSLGRKFKVVDPDDNKKYNEYLTKVFNEAKSISFKESEKRRKKWRHYFASKDEYADVKYTFATTIHKSQGSTYKDVYINISSIFSLISRGDKDMAYRLLYVAVTRASNDIKIML